MKAYLCIASLLSALVLIQCEITPELKSKVDECLKEFELTEDALKAPNFEDPKIHCFGACVLKKDDRLSEGKLSIDKEVEAATKYLAKDKIDDSLKDKITECVNKANEQKEDCAVSGVLYKCVTEKFGPLYP